MANTNCTAHREVTILNSQGLHARPVMQFVDVASRFRSTVTVSKDDVHVDAKSPMEMMLLEATCGTTLSLTAHGEDAHEVIEALANLILSRFEEA